MLNGEPHRLERNRHETVCRQMRIINLVIFVHISFYHIVATLVKFIMNPMFFTLSKLCGEVFVFYLYICVDCTYAQCLLSYILQMLVQPWHERGCPC